MKTNNTKNLKVVNESSGVRDRPKAPRTRSPSKKSIGVVEQVRTALRRTNRLPTLLGFLLGGFVPLASFVVAHSELDRAQPLHVQLPTYLVLGGLFYSAKTVHEWGKRAFMNAWKSAGFVVLIEGVMVTSHVQWLGFTALAYLIVINGIATGCTLSLDVPKEG